MFNITSKLLNILKYPPVYVWILWLLILLLFFYSSLIANGKSISDLFTVLTGWDGNWYKSILDSGYQTGPFTTQANVAFFPSYPILAWTLSKFFFLSNSLSLVLTSVACFLGGLIISYRLMLHYMTVHRATKIIVLIAVNPWSYYFAMAYGEALFFLLMSAVFLMTKTNRFYTAAIFAAIASSTRVIGILLGLFVVMSYVNEWRMNKYSKKILILKSSLLLVISGLGLVGFIAFLKYHTGDGLAFVHIQQYWERGSGLNGLFTQSSLMLQEIKHHTIWGYALLTFHIMTIVLLVTSVWFIVRKKITYGSFLILNTIIPIATGALTSMNRYAMIHIGIYFVIVTYLKGAFFSLAVSLSLVFLLFNIYLLTKTSNPFLG